MSIRKNKKIDYNLEEIEVPDDLVLQTLLWQKRLVLLILIAYWSFCKLLKTLFLHTITKDIPWIKKLGNDTKYVSLLSLLLMFPIDSSKDFSLATKTSLNIYDLILKNWKDKMKCTNKSAAQKMKFSITDYFSKCEKSAGNRGFGHISWRNL